MIEGVVIENIKNDILKIYNDNIESDDLIQKEVIKLIENYSNNKKYDLFIDVQPWGNEKGCIDIRGYKGNILEFAIEITDSYFNLDSNKKLLIVGYKNKILYWYGNKKLIFKRW